jgi:hypothetical protein
VGEKIGAPIGAQFALPADAKRRMWTAGGNPTQDTLFLVVLRSDWPVDPEAPGRAQRPSFSLIPRGAESKRVSFAPARLRRKTTAADGCSGRSIQPPRSTGQSALPPKHMHIHLPAGDWETDLIPKNQRQSRWFFVLIPKQRGGQRSRKADLRTLINFRPRRNPPPPPRLPNLFSPSKKPAPSRGL